MKKKKNNEPIVIDNRELMSTSLGTLDNKDNGLIIVVIVLILFMLCIVFLPNITALFNKEDMVSISTTEKKTNTNNEEEKVEEKDVYYDLSNELKVDIPNYTLSNFNVDKNNKRLTFTETFVKGDSSYLIKHNYYIELYNNELTFLGRVKITNKVITKEYNESLNISKSLEIGNIEKIVIKEISDNDIPSISIKENNNTYMITCSNDSETIKYYFNYKDDKYLLNNMIYIKDFNSNTSSYNDDLNTYNTLSTLLSNTDGVKITLSPTSKGFSYEAHISLDKVKDETLKKYFSESYYYTLNKEARIINFELTSLGYKCN